MERIEHLKQVKQELDREEEALLDFSDKLLNHSLDSENRYQLKELISEGGFKKVYRAHDKKTSRDIAYAILPSSEDDVLTKNRIVREARITALLDHSNIAPLYDLGQTEDGFYFTMKLMSGQKMSSLLLKPKLSAKQHFNKMLHHVIDVCEALSYAHSKGILHLDIKPSNIHVSDFGETYLFDWGVSKAIKPMDDDIINLEIVTENESIGTPGYMSPEQITGDEMALDERTDIFQVGALIYSIYTGKRLDDSKTADENFSFTLQSDIFGNKCPNSIQQIIKKAIQHDKEHRYQNTRELILDLENYLNHLPTSVDQYKLLKTIRSKIYHHPYLVALAVTLCIGILILKNHLSQIQLAHTERLAEEQSKTIDKIMPFANLPARNILSFYSHPNAGAMAKTLIETKPESSQAWILKGLIELSEFDFKAAHKTFQHLEEANFNISYQNSSVIRLKEKIKPLVNVAITDPKDADTILDLIFRLNEGRLNSLYSRNYYMAHQNNLEACKTFFYKALHKMSPQTVVAFQNSEDQQTLHVSLHCESERLATSTFLGMPYSKLTLSGMREVYMPHIISDSLKELDLSKTHIDEIFFLPDLNLEALNISNLTIRKIFYGGMPELKELKADNLKFEPENNIYKILSSCRSLEKLSAIGADPQSLIRSLKDLKKLKTLRCDDAAKKRIMKSKSLDIHFEILSEDQAL